MVSSKPLKVVLLTSYSLAAYEILSHLIKNDVQIVGVLFCPKDVRRLPLRTLIKSFFNSWRIVDPSLLLRRHGIVYSFVESHNNDGAAAFLKEKKPDITLLYGTKIIKPHILEIPVIGTLNSHSALLPHYRGGAAEFWMLYNNEPEYAGVTIHWVTTGLDEGDIVLQKSLTVTLNDDPNTLRARSVPITADLFVQAVQTITTNGRVGFPQRSTGEPVYRQPNDAQKVELKRRLQSRRRSLDTSILSAERWLQYSGIQNPQYAKSVEGLDLSGSFNSWFDLEKQMHAYVYPEISGYGATTLTYLYAITNDDVYLRRARLVGDWLVSIQDRSGGFPTALYRAAGSPQKPSELHTFDTGMILHGLVQLYRLTGYEPYLVAARRAADWCIAYRNEDGSCASQIDKETGAVCDTERTWSTQPGPHHVKLAIGFLNLFDVTKDETYKMAAAGMCDYALGIQQPSGRFLTYGLLIGTNLHPHLYAAEGLYVAGRYLNNDRYFEAGRKATAWAFSHAVRGMVPRHQHGEALNFNERVDILSQALRLAMLYKLDTPDLDRLTEIIKSYQYFQENQAQTGGFAFGKQSDGTPAPHLNSWVTMFALQALRLKRGDQFPDPFHLV